jgi:hypothetical protein
VPHLVLGDAEIAPLPIPASEICEGTHAMRLASYLLAMVVIAFAAVHGYFYVQTGTIDPCEAAVTRLIQEQRDKGEDLAAGLGVLFAPQIKDMMRSEGVAACYRTALTGEPPEVVVKLKRP